MRTEDRFSLYIKIQRALYEDKSALANYLNWVWNDQLRQAGGEPATEELTTSEGPRYRVDDTVWPFREEEIFPGQDDTGWTHMSLMVSGKAYRDDSRA